METQRKSLKSERANLALSLRDLERSACAAGQAAMARVMTTGVGSPRNGKAAQIAALRSELAAFDAAHPEILAEIEANRAVAADKNLTWI